jgi:hypothetical protein
MIYPLVYGVFLLIFLDECSIKGSATLTGGILITPYLFHLATLRALHLYGLWRGRFPVG